MPSAKTTIVCQRDHGRRSRRAGIVVLIVARVTRRERSPRARRQGTVT